MRLARHVQRDPLGIRHRLSVGTKYPGLVRARAYHTKWTNAYSRYVITIVVPITPEKKVKAGVHVVRRVLNQ